MYQASDNAVLCEISHKIRVNQALFIDVNTLLSIGEDKMLKITRFFLTKAGSGSDTSELVCVDIGAVLGGRPRDVFSIQSTLPSSESNKNKTPIAAVASSSGKVVLLSVPSLMESAAGDIDAAVIASHQVKGDPRLICVVAWDDAERGKDDDNSLEDKVKHERRESNEAGDGSMGEDDSQSINTKTNKRKAGQKNKEKKKKNMKSVQFSE